MEINNLGYNPIDYKKFTKIAWSTLISFSVLYVFVYCGRLNLGLSIPLIIEETGWNEAALGILSSILFWTYGCGHLINGRLGEVFGTKRFIIAGVFLTVIANVLISFQTSFVAIAILWGFNGYFQSMIWTPGLSLIAKWWPSNRRGFANGIATAATSLSSVVVWLAVYASFVLFPDMGWKAAFRFPMVFMIVFVVIFFIFSKSKPSDVGITEYKEENADMKDKEKEMEAVLKDKGKMYPFIFLLKQWQFDAWLIIIACSSLARYGLLTWIPSYYNDVFNTNIKDGIMGTIVLPLGMACGSFILPWLTDKFCPKNRMPAVIFCAIAAGLTVFGFSLAGPGLVSSTLLFFAGFFVYSINGIAWVYATDVGARIFAGTAAGVLDWAAYMGAAVQAIIFGNILAGGNWNAVFISIVSICALIAILSFFVSIGRKKQLQAVKENNGK